MRFVWRTLLFGLLTVLTQIGGVAYVISMPLRARFPVFAGVRGVNAFIWFSATYCVVLSGAYFIAENTGRQAISCFASDDTKLEMQSPLYCLLARNYANPRLLAAAKDLASDVDQRFPGTKTLALDGNFPFFDGFPMLPHLSHNDGNKLDLAFYYADPKTGYQAGQTKSPIGYWAFEKAQNGRTDPCEFDTSTWSTRWDMAWFDVFSHNLVLEPKRTAFAINWLARNQAKHGVTKVFVEPHLLARLNLSGANLRFQGCHAARHDDHIHFQVK